VPEQVEARLAPDLERRLLRFRNGTHRVPLSVFSTCWRSALPAPGTAR
jgi:hypothetical protein